MYNWLRILNDRKVFFYYNRRKVLIFDLDVLEDLFVIYKKVNFFNFFRDLGICFEKLYFCKFL